ncbi:MAG: RDD family protein [Prochloraceae cyanobacterium]
MFIEKPPYKPYPKVPIKRRAGAFFIDFVTVWFVSSIAGNWLLQLFVFILSWLILRVVVVEKNKGQSLGRWALDMKVIDPRFNRIPDLLTLTKREAIVGFAASLATLGLTINVSNSLSMLMLMLPLLLDCGLALSDVEYSQAFHDRLADTLIIETERGFSLDLRLQQLLDEIKEKMRQ